MQVVTSVKPTPRPAPTGAVARVWRVGASAPRVEIIRPVVVPLTPAERAERRPVSRAFG